MADDDEKLKTKWLCYKCIGEAYLKDDVRRRRWEKSDAQF